ncbi:OmpH family outer membrane protein [Persicimonas caeni]|uniref:OmpH family outer membrane protein n=2 Tax=Persicimonas caeni TaxID=2292766 RepID=A0A4Y6Q183_PERCE|nr:OmpH family outer membrane protein [Persicimonas caeni]QED35559.1 OmpH family outer membrane protein [Persicimonas caeni]
MPFNDSFIASSPIGAKMIARIMKTRAAMVMAQVLLAFGLVVGVTAISAPAFAQDVKIGYVDLQRALSEVEEGKKAKARLKKDFDKKQKMLTDKQEEVKKLKQSLESGAAMMTDEAKRKKAIELQQEMAKLQQLYMEMQRDLAQKETKATQKIFKKMEPILNKIAKEKGYDLILEKTESSVLFAKDSMDLTDELIKRYDKK